MKATVRIDLPTGMTINSGVAANFDRDHAAGTVAARITGVEIARTVPSVITVTLDIDAELGVNFDINDPNPRMRGAIVHWVRKDEE